tara:strand:- start:216 stop:1355 length:1140 start_codon:yes stop_codon:yes gene_type:complete
MNKLQFVLVFIFFLLEFSNERFSFQIPVIPYSLGYLSFIIGSFFLKTRYTRSYFMLSFLPIFIFWFGMFIGSFFANDINNSLGISFASIPYYLACASFSYIFFEKKYEKLIIGSIIIVLIINVLYLLTNIIIGGGIISYSSLDSFEFRNHHNVGFLISISAIFLSSFTLFNGKFKYSISIFIISSIFLLLTESRSNLIFYVTTYLLSLFIHFKFYKFLLNTLLILLLVIPLSSYIFNNSNLKERFSTTNINYHLDTTDDRREVLILAPNVILNNIFGRGNKEFRVEVGVNNMVAHNMYLTSLLAGGVISFFGLVLILYRSFISIRKLYKKSLLSPFEMSLASIFFLISITFLSIEFFGFNLLIYFSLYFYFNYKSSLIK